MSAKNGATPREPKSPREAAGRPQSVVLPEVEPKPVDFLQQWRPLGPWVLAAIDSGGRLGCREFDDADEARRWIEERQECGANMYWQPNDCRLGPNGKPRREDVLRATCLQVDIDPEPGLPIDEARAKIQKRIDECGSALPAPTVDIASGGGRQLLWQLREPHEFSAKDQREDFERYNQQLSRMLGGDHCHAVNHLLRLPGTTNFPTAEKRAKNPGRDDAAAYVVSATWEKHDIGEFTKSKASEDVPSRNDAVRIDLANVPRTHDLDADLPEGVPSRVKAVIVQGEDPDQPLNGDDQSRSAWLFYVCCELVRNGVSDDRIFGIITDPDYKISASVLDKGTGRQRYALRQIKQAKQAVAVESCDDYIDITPGQLDAALDKIQEVILSKEVSLFQRGGTLAMPIRLDEDQEDTAGVRRNAGSLVLHRPKGAGLLSVFIHHASFFKVKASGPTPVDPDIKFAAVFEAGRERWKLRPLDVITGTPVFRNDGTILQEPGYDAATRLWFDPGGCEFPAVPENPTRDDALAALELLKRPFRGFPIPRDECKSALVAALITPAIVPVISAVPAVGISASTPGFGKTLVQRCIGVMAMGTDPAAMSHAESDEENGKRLDSALLSGDSTIAIDNVTRPVGGDVLCSIITNPVHRPRILGKSEVPMISSRVQVLVNGNNLAFWGDMCRRVVMVLIEDDEEEKPQEREFDFDPVEETKSKRGEMVAAALTILRAWHVAGRPKPEGHKPLGSFEGWEPVRLALIWLGMEDPAKTQDLVTEDDPQREADRDLLWLLWEAQGDAEFKARDLREKVHAEGKSTGLGDALLGGGPWNSKRAGNRLRRFANCWIDGVRLKKVGGGKHGLVYRIEWRDGKKPERDAF